MAVKSLIKGLILKQGKKIATEKLMPIIIKKVKNRMK